MKQASVFAVSLVLSACPQQPFETLVCLDGGADGGATRCSSEERRDAGGPSDSGAPGGGTAGGANSAGVGGGSSATSYGAFLTSVSNAYCQQLIRCGPATASGLSICNEAARMAVLTFLPSERSVAIGASSVDPVAAANCLAEFGNPGCSLPRACSNVRTPLAMLNGACDTSRDCVGGTLSCNGASCMKRCTEGGNLGEGCKVGDLCNAPFVCIGGTCVNEPAPGTPCQSSCGSNSQCRNRVCERLTTVGGSCATIPCVPQAHCDFFTQVCRPKLATGSSCLSESQCETSRCVSGRCEAPGSPGEWCRFDEDCATGLSCFVPGLLGSSGQCRTKGQVGAPCSGFRDCSGGLTCDDVSLTCRQSTAVSTGQPCSSTQYCSRSTDSCRNLVVVSGRDGGTNLPGTCGPVQVGDACTSNSSCETGKYCDTTTDRCAAAASGSPCSNSSNCLSTEYCNSSGVCAAKAPAGQVCDSRRSESCSAAGERCLSTSTPGQSRCQPVPEVGSPCINQCAWGAACRNGLCVASGRVGQPCLSGTGCFPGVCRFDAGVGLCDAPLANGAACIANTECQSGSCDRGLCVAACP